MDLARTLRGLPGRALGRARRDRSPAQATGEAAFRSAYHDERRAEAFAHYHAIVRRRRPTLLYEATRILAMPLFLLWRPHYIDSENVPEAGPAILAPNHFSFLDHFFVGILLRRRLTYMAKSQLFTFPLELWLAGMSTFPIRRGHQDEEAFATARAVLERGDVLIMYAEGGRSRPGELGSPKSGIGRLALQTGAPVVPVAIEGTQRLGDSKRLRFHQVTVRYGAPIRFPAVEAPGRERARAASAEIFDRVRRMHSEITA